MLRLTNGEASTSRGTDEIDYGFEEIEEFILEEEMEIDLRSNRSSRTPFDDGDNDIGNGDRSDPDYVEEATESFEEDDDEFDQMVTRGRSKRKTTKDKEKKEKPKKSSTSRRSRTRAVSVR